MPSLHTQIAFESVTTDQAGWLMTLRDLLERETLERAGKPYYRLSDLSLSLYDSLLSIVIASADTALRNSAQAYGDEATERLAEDLIGLAQCLQGNVEQWRISHARAAAIATEALRAQEILAESFDLSAPETLVA